MDIRFEKPCRRLQPYVECYWSWESNKRDAERFCLPKVMPNTDTEVVIYYKSPLSVKSTLLPQSHVVFLHDEAVSLSLPKGGELGFVAIRFRPGCFRHFFDGMPGELTDRFVSLSDVWGRLGEELEARVLAAPHFAQRIFIIESFLLRQQSVCMKEDRWLDAAVSALLKQAGNLELERMTQSFHFSKRQFQRLFKQSVGMSAKRFQRLVRFESTVKKCMQNRNGNPLSIILAQGYFDQSHFYKECRQFMNEKPGPLLRDKTYLSFFYNQSEKG